MEWHNAARDKLPGHDDMVLISFKGVYYICIFDAVEKKFRLKDRPDTFFEMNGDTIYWVEMDHE